MSSRADRPASPRRLRGWIWLCLFSLLAFQGLGQVHRALHGGGLSGLPGQVLQAGAAQTHGHDAGSAAFGHTAGSTDCQLLDELSQFFGPTVQAQSWTALLPDAPASTAQPHSASPARVWRAPARAPPLA